ncbi:MAG: response regulator [candidate division Zixibacteria bacterium]|nr:response regulator [candidate division Zixibacteria bacterium]
MNDGKILVVDDDASLRRIIEFNLKKKAYKPTMLENAEEAVTHLRKSDYELMISDIRMPGMDGLELLQIAREIKPDLPVIFITAFGTIEMAVEAMKLGAYDYITKPFDVDDFIHTVEKALDYHRLLDENMRLKKELKNRDSFSNIIAASKPMQNIFNSIRKVANTDTTILITGESGTGKELIARAIHRESERSDNTMITVNCAAIPKDLLESELFGHVAGAFTGAVKNKAGKFQLADGGTIFLDEIGDLSMELQAKLLRVLENRLVEPVGSNESIPVDIRVLAATNQDLNKKLKAGEFREDLYYRLNVIPIHIPPLRERREDIPLLVKHFLNEFSDNEKLAIDPKALTKLNRYDWPGNVRELKNLLKRLALLAENNKIKLTDLPPEIRSNKGDTTGNGYVNNNSLRETERNAIVDALKSTGWNQTRAAKRLQIPRHVLIYRMKKYDIKEE